MRDTINKCVIRALGAYAALSLIYTGMLAVIYTDSTVQATLGALAGNLVGDLAAIFLFSAVFGFSFIVFSSKLLPSAAKRFLHIVILFADTVFVFLVISAQQESTQDKVKFWFFATFVYLIVYGLCWLTSFIIRRIKNRT